ncbi:N-acylneuraminate cytidylyltransferase A, partial [Lucilia cuprina]|uniref:N-acylneuraminate cytidylyltransferase A n=1 Tax=Lucilia cuprina TaxID=7375 RepID=UPI001F070F0C
PPERFSIRTFTTKLEILETFKQFVKPLFFHPKYPLATVFVVPDRRCIPITLQSSSGSLVNGALVYRRLHVFAQDHSSSLEAIKEFLNKHNFVKKFALFQCTSVFLKEKYIIEAVHKFNFHPCVFAAKRSHKLRWKQLGTNLIIPLNFNPFHRPRRQDWDGELDETGMFYFATKQLVNKNSLQNNRCAIVEVDAQDAVEIDNMNDLKMAQCMLK